nr:phosphotransferase [uncultured Carboxylicivirga sp.]
MTWQIQLSIPFEKKIIHILQVEYGVTCLTFERIESGFSNLLYQIKTKTGKFILRVSHFSKTSSAIRQEEIVLEKLESLQNTTNTPQIIRTISNTLHCHIHIDKKYAIHLFHYIEGATKYQWHDIPNVDDLKRIVLKYKDLNCKLQTISASSITNYYLNNYTEILNQANETNWDCLKGIQQINQADIQSFSTNAFRILTDLKSIIPKLGMQYIHEDFQLENILFKDNNICGIIDFEHTQYGYEEIDAILSAFRICKKGKSDSLLDIDKSAFDAFVNLYFGSNKWYTLEKEIAYEQWLCFFALQQSLLYIKNAMNGIWKLAEGIGFLPCFNTVNIYNVKECQL